MKHPLSDLDTVQSEFSSKRQCQERQELSVFRCAATAQPIPNQFQTPFPNPFQNNQLFQNPQLNELQNRQNQTQMQQNLLHNQHQQQTQQLNGPAQWAQDLATPPVEQQTEERGTWAAQDGIFGYREREAEETSEVRYRLILHFYYTSNSITHPNLGLFSTKTKLHDISACNVKLCFNLVLGDCFTAY